MALTKCPECDTQVSDKAEKCPSCAYPIASRSDGKVQTIEQTGKKYKLRSLIGGILLAVGIVFSFIAETVLFQIMWVVLALAGLILMIVSRILIWWHHR